MSHIADPHQLLAKFWQEAWSDGLWAASWSKSLEGLTPAQAAWTPSEGRHSIWQIVMHMVFWRENELRRFATGKGPSAEEVERLNFPRITDTSASAWDEARARFRSTQEQIAAVYADPTKNVDRAQYLVPHDAYHFGQINYLRALLGLAPIE